MKNLIYILVSFMAMTMSATVASASDADKVETIASEEVAGLFAYNAVDETVEYISEQGANVLFARNSSSQGIFRHIESRRSYNSGFKTILFYNMTRLQALAREASFQTESASGSGSRSVSELIYIFRTIII